MADKFSELAEIKRFGGTPQKNSGRGAHKKGDAILDPFTVDVKEYTKSYAISTNTWSKICTDAARNGNEPALMLALGDSGKIVRIWAISDAMFKQMHDAWMEKYGE